MNETVSYRLDSGVAQVSLNRPDKINALNYEMFESLVEAGENIKATPAVRAVVLSGAGMNFCGGIDVSILTGEKNFPDLEERTHGDTNIFQHVAWVWREIPVPVIAAVQGYCLGAGLQVASGADMRFVHPDSKLSVMEIKWGIVPDMAGTVLWSRYVREDHLRELTYTGRTFSGSEAASLGFATRLCEDPIAEALQVAREIADKNPDAIRAGKRLINNQLPPSSKEGLLAEVIEQKALLESPNQLEAVKAIAQKREPKFNDPA